jgi:hypothetical protein
MFTRNSVRIGDLAAGTLLVYTRADATLARLSDQQLDARTAEVLSELLQRWSALDDTARRRIAAMILPESATATDDELRIQLENLMRGTR